MAKTIGTITAIGAKGGINLAETGSFETGGWYNLPFKPTPELKTLWTNLEKGWKVELEYAKNGDWRNVTTLTIVDNTEKTKDKTPDYAQRETRIVRMNSITNAISILALPEMIESSLTRANVIAIVKQIARELETEVNRK